MTICASGLKPRVNEILSVFRHGWIDEIRPRIDSAFEIIHVGETPLLQQSRRLCAAATAVTMNDERLLAVQLVCALGDFTERDQFGSIDLCDLEFERLPYIDQLERFARIHLPFQFLHGHSRNTCVVHASRKTDRNQSA